MATAEQQRRDFTITKVERHPEGYFTARVSAGGRTVEVDNRYGSWQANVRRFPGARSFDRREVLAPIPAELQKKVRSLGARRTEVRR